MDEAMKLSGDRLKQAFAPVPPEFERGIETAFLRGELAARRRRRFAAPVRIAAALVVLLAVAALAVGSLSRPQPDNVVLSGGGAPQATALPKGSGGGVTRSPLQTATDAKAFGTTLLSTSIGATPLPTSSAPIEPLSLEQRLTNVLNACMEEGGPRTDVNTKTKRVDKAVNVLMEVPEEYGADTAQ